MEFHSLEVRQQALALLRNGTSNAEVARKLGVPKGTVGYWLHMDRAKQGTLPGRPPKPCPRCDGNLDRAAYSYLLGLYLGDGHIMQCSKHRVPHMVITCCDTWPGLMDAAEAAMQAVFPNNSTCRIRKWGCHNVKVYSKHLPCLFPQHGPGRKHERPIRLVPWQQEIVDEYPWELVRGLIHSDGCRITNWTVRTVSGVPTRYEYPRYFFTNASDDIRRICTDTLDRLGVAWAQMNARNISVARRGAVALMDAHIGAKF